MRPVILHVEDSRTCTAHLAARLTKGELRASVVVARTIAEARTWLATPGRPALALAVLDLQLPDGDGRELLPLLADVQVVVVSSVRAVLPGVVVVQKGAGWALEIERTLDCVMRKST